MYLGFTKQIASAMFPFTPAPHLSTHFAEIVGALEAARASRGMSLVALATIRAEAETFQPLLEQPSSLNTSPGGRPFDLYDRRAALGNAGPPDGERFRGRGYVQLTGRYNYGHFSKLVSLDLLADPELAAQPAPAAAILIAFLASRRAQIDRALLTGDLALARRAVNGGTNGLSRFCEAYRAGDSLLPS